MWRSVRAWDSRGDDSESSVNRVGKREVKLRVKGRKGNTYTCASTDTGLPSLVLFWVTGKVVRSLGTRRTKNQMEMGQRECRAPGQDAMR